MKTDYKITRDKFICKGARLRKETGLLMTYLDPSPPECIIPCDNMRGFVE